MVSDTEEVNFLRAAKTIRCAPNIKRRLSFESPVMSTPPRDDVSSLTCDNIGANALEEPGPPVVAKSVSDFNDLIRADIRPGVAVENPPKYFSMSASFGSPFG